MVSAANHDAYGNPGWGSRPTGGPSSSPWGPPPWMNQGWQGRPDWARDVPKPVWIAFMVLGFIFWWPVGLAMLVYLMASGRLSCGSRGRHWANQPDGYASRPDGGSSSGWGWGRWGGGGDRPPPSSGNWAFDEYRAETLRRLEEEQREFGAFLERLRVAKDKAEFDQFMAERRGRPPQPADQFDAPTQQ